MSNYTVIRADNSVLVDGAGQSIDCSHLPSFFHALQWYGGATPPYGEIEYSSDAQGQKIPNTRFSDFTPYQYLVDAWMAARDAAVAAAAKAATKITTGAA